MIGFLVLVFFEAQDVSTALPAALAESAEEALGPGAEIAIRTIDKGAGIDRLLAAGREAKAFAVARVSWGGAAREDARLTLAVVATGRTSAQPLAFRTSDPLPERGRALGLVLAALLEAEIGVAARAGAPPAPPAVMAAAAAPPSAPPPAGRRRWALDAAGEGGFALGGAGSGSGGALGLRGRVLPRVSFRLGLRARFGQVGVAQATSLGLAASAGVSVPLLDPVEGGRFGLALRGEALLLYESLSHLSSDDPAPDRRGRALPGAALLGEAHWSLSPAVAILVAAGPEVAFGTTEVFVRHVEVAELAPVRLVVQAGVLAAF